MKSVVGFLVGFAGPAAVMIPLLAGLSRATSNGFASRTVLPTPNPRHRSAPARTVGLWELRTPSPAIDVRVMLSRRVGPIHIAGFLFGLVIFGSPAPLTTFSSVDPDTVGYGFSASSASVSLVIAVVAGFGMGLLLGGLPMLLAEVTPQEQTRSSVGVYNSSCSLGGATGGSLFAVVVSTATIGGYVLMRVLCAVTFLLAAIALTFLPVHRQVSPHRFPPDTERAPTCPILRTSSRHRLPRSRTTALRPSA